MGAVVVYNATSGYVVHKQQQSDHLAVLRLSY